MNLHKMEAYRVYIFPNGYPLKIENVINCESYPDGTQKLETENGEVVIVKNSYLAIKIREK